MLIDVTHMRPDALARRSTLLDALDREHGAAADAHPVIASHAGYRFGGQNYNLDEPTRARGSPRATA